MTCAVNIALLRYLFVSQVRFALTSHLTLTNHALHGHQAPKNARIADLFSGCYCKWYSFFEG